MAEGYRKIRILQEKKWLWLRCRTKNKVTVKIPQGNNGYDSVRASAPMPSARRETPRAGHRIVPHLPAEEHGRHPLGTLAVLAGSIPGSARCSGRGQRCRLRRPTPGPDTR